MFSLRAGYSSSETRPPHFPQVVGEQVTEAAAEAGLCDRLSEAAFIPTMVKQQTHGFHLIQLQPIALRNGTENF
jgi:hypothetical protein